MLKYVQALVLLGSITSAEAALANDCSALSQSSVQSQIVENIIAGSYSLQGRVEYQDNGGATAFEMRKALQFAEDSVARSRKHLPAGDVAYLLVSNRGGDPSPAINVSPANGDFTCLVRRGDTVLLSDGPNAHWTLVESIDKDNVRFVDQWPDQFLFLDANSGGIWNARVERSAGGKSIVVSRAEFVRLLTAIVTVDDSLFAVRLLSDSCSCVTSSASLQSIYDTLLDHGQTSDVKAALELASHWRAGKADDVSDAYRAATIYIGGFIGSPISQADSDSLVAYLEKKSYEAFKPLSPNLALALYETSTENESTLGKILRAASTDKSIHDQYTPLQNARRMIHDGEIYKVAGDMGAAIDQTKLAASQLDQAYDTSLAQLKDAASRGWHRDLEVHDSFELFQAAVDSHAALVELYVSTGNLKMGSTHFRKLNSYEAPVPLNILAKALLAGCRAAANTNNAAALEKILADEEFADKKAMLALSCFQD